MSVDVRTEIVIDRPVIQVANYATDPSNAPEWYANIESIDWKTPPPPQVGSAVTFVARFLGRRLEYTYDFVELVPGERLVMRTKQGPFPMETTYTWVAVGDGSTRMTGAPDRCEQAHWGQCHRGCLPWSSMDTTGEPWAALSASARVLAEAGQRLLEDAPGVPGVAFLGTVGLDGLPRIHPFIPAVLDGTLWAFVITSPKQRDLDRSGGFAIHSLLGRDDESFFCAGSARRVDDEDLRSTVGRVMPYDDIDDRHLLYEFLIARALWTTWTTPTSPIHTTWTSRRG